MLLLDQIKANVTTAAAAAGLVFMHSAYENAVFDLIKRLVQYDPTPWVQYVDKRKVPLETVLASSVSQIQSSLLDEWLKQAAKKSLPWKVQKVFEVLKPETTKDVISGFEFKIAELERIDSLRHEMTHRPKFATPFGDVVSMLTFLHKTVVLLEKLAEQKYPGQTNAR